MATPLAPELLQELRAFDSPTICNAIEPFKVRDDTQGYLGMDVRCLTPEFGVMLGYAVTATADSVRPATPRDRRGQLRMYEAIAASPKPVVLVMKDVGGRPTHACFLGDVMATICSRLGAVGLVTDGGVRDLDGIRPLGFHMFAAGLVVAHGTLNILDVNVPVELSGVRIAPGDLIHGDANGVTTIPPGIADRLAAECLRGRERESALKDYVHSRDFGLEGLRQRLLGA